MGCERHGHFGVTSSLVGASDLPVHHGYKQRFDQKSEGEWAKCSRAYSRAGGIWFSLFIYNRYSMSRIVYSQKFFEMMSSALASWRMESFDSPLLRMAPQIAEVFELAVEPACHFVNLRRVHLDGRMVLGANDRVPQHIQIHELSGAVLHVERASRALLCPPCLDTSLPSFTDSFTESQSFL